MPEPGHFSGEDYINSANDTNGDKSVGGATSGNFTIAGDVELTSSSGDAGVLVRVTDPTVGADSVDAYYLGIDSSGFIEIGKESYGWTLLAAAPLNAAPANTWIHLTAQVVGCQIRLTAQPVNSSTPSSDVTVDRLQLFFRAGRSAIVWYIRAVEVSQRNSELR